MRRAVPFLLPALAVLSLAGVLPLGFVAFYSVHDTFGGNVFVWVGTHWYKTVLTSPEFYHALLRSLGFALLVLAVQIPLGLWIALRLPRDGWAVSVVLVVLALPMLTPQIVVGFLWKAMAQPDTGLLHETLELVGITLRQDSIIATWALLILMDTWHWIGLVVLLCYARLRAIPQAYYQAATIDAASPLAVFRHIQLPRLRLVLTIAILLRFMDSFTIYAESYALTRGGPGLSTVFLSQELVQTGLIQFDLGEAGAMAMIYFAIVVLVSALFYRLVIPTTTRGAA